MQLPVLERPHARKPPEHAAAPPDGPIRDAFGRGIGYLRLSLTAVCALRCTYCRPRTYDNPRDEKRLSVNEIGHLVDHLAQHHSLRKVRVTGGDPSSRPDLLEILQRISSVPGIEDLAMTTHGLTLRHRAAEYAAAGLNRVNVSLDTLDPQRFANLTGIDALERVLEGLAAAEDSGLGPIKLNTVVVRGQNELDLPVLVRYAAERNYAIRFIELMPMGPLAATWSKRFVSEQQMQRILDPIVTCWHALPQGESSARVYRATLDDGQTVQVGFITPMSCNFCAACNRIRITADGTLYPCLMDRPGPRLESALRPRFDPQLLDELISTGLQHKRAEHPHDGHAIMTHIGG